ncbi:MAG TPA: hypothetical protein VFV58_39275 [Blastocatellia bacterium]|jgi:hypothetical protein|nr:hypothetical protein [Blastocatellia bacterium]
MSTNIKVELVGTTPILMHNPSAMSGSKHGKLDTKKVPEPEDEAAAGRYLDEKGNFVFPTVAVKAAIASGGKGRRIGKLSALGVLKATIFPLDEYFQILDAKGKPMSGKSYTVDTRRVVLNKTIGIMRSRPKIENWRAVVNLEVDDTIVENLKMIEEIGNLAGRMVGIGDYRPEKGGPFGRFSLRLLETSKN